jgi:predicted amidophosphoribosyltransferase
VNVFGFFEKTDLTGADFLRVKNSGTHRICFTETHKNALTTYKGKFPFKFAVPFDNGIKQVFDLSTGLNLYRSAGGIAGWWVGLENEIQKEVVRNWILSQGTRVYMRDLLDISVCLSLNMSSDRKHTEIGELENRAKYNKDRVAIDQLANYMSKMICACPVLSRSDAIAPIPPRQNKDFDLPTEIAKILAPQIGKPLIHAGVWNGSKGQLKAVPFQDKWNTLEGVGFTPSPAAKITKSLILIDDLYQSGSTLNFIGAKIKNANNGEVMGMCAVKSMRDTDNN